MPEDKRARVMSYYTMAFFGSAPFGSLLAGTLAHRIGAPHTVIVTGDVLPRRLALVHARAAEGQGDHAARSTRRWAFCLRSTQPRPVPELKGPTTMNWYDYIAAFLAGMFLANVVPHFVHGISGDRFPTPFAHPPGRGLSSPTVNVAWALFNLVIGYILFRIGRVSSGDDVALLIFFAGIAAISIMASVQFAKKHAG